MVTNSSVKFQKYWWSLKNENSRKKMKGKKHDNFNLNAFARQFFVCFELFPAHLWMECWLLYHLLVLFSFWMLNKARLRVNVWLNVKSLD